MGLVCLLSVINIVLVSMLMCLWSSIFSIVGVWPGTSRPNKTEMAGITPVQVWGTFVVAQSMGYLLFTFSPTQHRGPNKCDGQPDPFWSCTSQPNDVTNRIWDYGTEEQRTILSNKEGVDIWQSTDRQTPKRKELIFEKYRRPNPNKERADLWQKYRRRTNLRMERDDL